MCWLRAAITDSLQVREVEVFIMLGLALPIDFSWNAWTL